jgi:hypothetical protein
VASYTPRSHYLRNRLYRKLDKFKRPSGRFRKEKNPSSVPIIEPQFLGRPARSLVTTLSTKPSYVKQQFNPTWKYTYSLIQRPWFKASTTHLISMFGIQYWRTLFVVAHFQVVPLLQQRFSSGHNELLKKRLQHCGLHSCGARHGAVARSCNHGNKCSGPQNMGSSLTTLSTTSEMVH